MVLVNTMPAIEMKTPMQRISIALRMLIVRVSGLSFAGKLLANRLFPGVSRKQLRKIFLKRWRRNRKSVYLSLARSMLKWDVTDRLGEIDLPTLIVTGDHDYTSVASKQTYVDKMKNAELVVIENSRHATPADQPEKLNRCVSDFFIKQELVSR